MSAMLSIPVDTINMIFGSIVIVVPLAAALPVYVILRRYVRKASS
jgi:hypothetical protein